jgi:predicted NBD/HSP70 family sugar kinase
MRKIDLTNFTVATSEIARHINRRIALNIIRRQQPMSRADLARRSGLQRSTVSAIVGELIVEGWVTEGATAASARGRRPRVLHLNVERAGILAVDIRPETTRAGLAGLDARFITLTEWPTPATPAEFVEELVETVAVFKSGHREVRCEGVGVSVAGRVDSSGRLVFAPNLRWPPVDLKDMIEGALGLPVAVENAASACALAELWFGRHSDDVKHLVAVTVSEGIGVGMLVNGQLVHGHNWMAGEFGHATLVEDGQPCGCGKRGCWEQYASNSAALRYYREAQQPPSAASDPPAGLPLKFTDLLNLAENGDERAGAALDRMAHYLGIGLGPVITGLAPQVVVVVGEVAAAWPRIGAIVERIAAERSLPAIATRIVATDPATQPRLRGAVALVVQQHFGAPEVA